MHITVVGGGIGGLSSAICLTLQGHTVCVLEAQAGPAEFGAGLQMSPNALRIMDEWGVLQLLRPVAFAPQKTMVRRYSNGKRLGVLEQNPAFESRYGYPYWQVYRPDLQKGLLQRAYELGVHVRFDCRVLKVDVDQGICTLTDNNRITSDLVVAADGIGSKIREQIDASATVDKLPDLTYRAVIPAQRMRERPTTQALIENEEAQLFFGPKVALLSYPIAAGQSYNIAITAIDHGPSYHKLGRWDLPVTKAELRSVLQSFCEPVQDLVGLIENCAKWSIAEVSELPRWSSGKCVLLGDAAHAMSPHLAQGSAMAIEDAAALGCCLASHSMQDALLLYESVRKPRVRRVAELARQNGASMVLEDGPEQRERDRRMAAAPAVSPLLDVKADMNAPWPQPLLLMWLYGYDVHREIEVFRLSRREAYGAAEASVAQLLS